MDPLSPVVPSILIGSVAYKLRDRAHLWAVPVVIFFFLLGLQVFLISKYLVPPPDLPVVMYTSITDYLAPMLLVSLYFALLSVVFLLAGKGTEQILERYLRNDLIRMIVVTYITLLLLQLWVEVFPWTLLVPYRLYLS